MIIVKAVKLLKDSEFVKKKENLLNKFSTFSKERFNKYKNLKSLQRTLMGELIVKEHLSEVFNKDFHDIEFKFNEKGKPFFNEDIKFNISHSGEWVVAAFSTYDVGIDIELIRQPNYEVANRYFSLIEIEKLNSENDILKRRNLFFDYWTIKESYLKAIGTGLTKSLSSFTVNINKNRITINDSDSIEMFYIFQINFDENYKLSVCGKENLISDKIEILKKL